MKRVFLLLALAMLGSSQNAHVIELSKDDTAKAQQLYDRLTKAKKEWDEFVLSMREKYTTAPESTPFGDVYGFTTTDGRPVRVLRPWNDIQFTKDFRYIVPK